MNKKKLIGWIAGAILSLGIIGGGTAGIIVATHEHEFSSEWKYDESAHWHGSTCSHEEEVSDYGEHEWTVSSTPSTCKVAGSEKKSCITCGYEKTTELPLAEHAWDNGVEVDAGCENDGYTLYTCTNCGDTKKENIVSALGHTYFSEYDYDAESHWHVSLCEHEDATTDKVAHTLSNWETKRPAGCLSDEILHRTCICGYEETKKGEDHKANAHTFDVGNEYYCTECKCYIVDGTSLNTVANTIEADSLETITYLVTGESTITSGDIARGATTVIIEGDNPSASLTLTGDTYKKIEAGESNLTIKNLQIKDARTGMVSWETWNIMIKSNKLHVLNCSLNNGLLLSSQTDIIIEGCTFLKGHSNHYAIWVGQKGEFNYEDNIENVTIRNNHITGYRAIKTLTSGASISILKNTFDTIEEKPALNISSVIGEENTIIFDKNRIINCAKGVYETENGTLNKLQYGENLVR